MRGKLFCVFTFSNVIADYECLGVFTKREDAETFRDSQPEAADKKAWPNGLPIVQWTFAELTDHLVRCRLGKLAGILFAKEGFALELPRGVMLPSGISAFPAHVARGN